MTDSSHGSTPMDSASRRAAAKDLLELILEFFPRVEAKLSLILGVDSALLGLIAVNAPAVRHLEWYMVFATVPALLICASLLQVYWGSFPNLEGGNKSLVYFREIARQTEPNFMADFRRLTDEELAQEMLSQAWRNACILRDKFDHLKTAFQITAWALVPWAISIAMFASKNAEATTLLTK
jgi:Pycsar effector protein